MGQRETAPHLFCQPRKETSFVHYTQHNRWLLGRWSCRATNEETWPYLLSFPPSPTHQPNQMKIFFLQQIYCNAINGRPTSRVQYKLALLSLKFVMYIHLFKVEEEEELGEVRRRAINVFPFFFNEQGLYSICSWRRALARRVKSKSNIYRPQGQVNFFRV